MNGNDPILARYQLATQVAIEAGRLTLQYFQTDRFEVERKADDSPVTVADRQAEQLLRERIAAAFPDDAILGEELGATGPTSGSPFRWILDPIDGTKSFIHGVPLYTTLIGLEFEGRSVVGVIYAPATEEIVHAAAGHGAWYSKGNQLPKPARVSSVSNLADSLLLTSEVAGFTQFRSADALPQYLKLQNMARLSRTWGDAYGYLMVAVGRAEVMIDPVMNVWDAAPLLPILEEAGGTFTDWRGEATIHGGEGIGTNGRVLAEVLAVVRGS